MMLSDEQMLELATQSAQIIMSADNQRYRRELIIEQLVNNYKYINRLNATELTRLRSIEKAAQEMFEFICNHVDPFDVPYGLEEWDESLAEWRAALSPIEQKDEPIK